jgi:hypothetical protein
MADSTEQLHVQQVHKVVARIVTATFEPRPSDFIDDGMRSPHISFSQRLETAYVDEIANLEVYNPDLARQIGAELQAYVTTLHEELKRRNLN